MATIAIVLHDLRGGGAEKMMVRLANQMVEDGDSVSMILITGGGTNKRYLSPRVNLIELNCRRTLDAFAPLRRTLKLVNPDGILAALTHINVITAIVCASLGWLKRLSVSERNAFSLDKNVNSNKVMKAAYFLAPYIYRILPNPVIAVSQGVADDLVQTTAVRAKDVVVAPNPVITNELEASAKEPPTHPWLIDKSTQIIVAVGRLAYQKGFDMLLDALFRVNKEINCKLIIYGEGDLRESLQNQIQSLGIAHLVSLPGYTENPIAEMRAADIYVLSSRFEGSPNAIVEAMSVNTTVIAFDCPHGSREILQGGEVASLVEYQNVEMLADEVIHALKLRATADYSEHTGKYTAKNAASIYRKLVLVN